MVDGADEEVDGGVGCEGEDEGRVGGADPFGFEADEEGEGGRVYFARRRRASVR